MFIFNDIIDARSTAPIEEDYINKEEVHRNLNLSEDVHRNLNLSEDVHRNLNLSEDVHRNLNLSEDVHRNLKTLRKPPTFQQSQISD